MNHIHETFNEVDELRGRLSAIMVNYPDTEIRLRPAIEVLDILLSKPTTPMIQEAVSELIELRTYFHDIIDKYDDMRRSFSPSVDLIDKLLGPPQALH